MAIEYRTSNDDDGDDGLTHTSTLFLSHNVHGVEVQRYVI